MLQAAVSGRLDVTARVQAREHSIFHTDKIRRFDPEARVAMLTVMGRRAFAQSLQKTLDIIASEARAGTATAAAAAV